MRKTYSVTNDKELRHFIRFLPFYRSFLFRFLYFDVHINEEYNFVLPIVESLNIKSRKKRIVYIYNEAFSMIDSYFVGKDFCQFIDNVCLSHRENKTGKMNGCCRCCPYRSGGYCPTKNIACKLFYCSRVKEKYEIIKFEDIILFRVLSPFQRMILKSDFFSSGEDVILDLYYGPFIAPIRIIYRFFKNYVYKKRK